MIIYSILQILYFYRAFLFVYNLFSTYLYFCKFYCFFRFWKYQWAIIIDFFFITYNSTNHKIKFTLTDNRMLAGACKYNI